MNKFICFALFLGILPTITGTCFKSLGCVECVTRSGCTFYRLADLTTTCTQESLDITEFISMTRRVRSCKMEMAAFSTVKPTILTAEAGIKLNQLPITSVKPHVLTTIIPKPSSVTFFEPKPSNVTIIEPKPSILTFFELKTSNVTIIEPKPTSVTTIAPKASIVTIITPKPSILTSHASKPSIVTIIEPKPSNATIITPKPSILTSTSPKLITFVTQPSVWTKITPKPTETLTTTTAVTIVYPIASIIPITSVKPTLLTSAWNPTIAPVTVSHTTPMTPSSTFSSQTVQQHFKVEIIPPLVSVEEKPPQATVIIEMPHYSQTNSPTPPDVEEELIMLNQGDTDVIPTELLNDEQTMGKTHKELLRDLNILRCKEFLLFVKIRRNVRQINSTFLDDRFMARCLFATA